MRIVGALVGVAIFWPAGGAAPIGALGAGALMGALGRTGGVITTGFAGAGMLVAGGEATMGEVGVLGACLAAGMTGGACGALSIGGGD